MPMTEIKDADDEYKIESQMNDSLKSKHMLNRYCVEKKGTVNSKLRNFVKL